MAEPLNGLRFDIYERVQLPDQAESIEELEEIELLPFMQALNQEDQILLKGHLLLSGLYRTPDSDNGGTRLEHKIPVEISLPPNRVQRVEDLAVSIDNFDVDLLSARSLNVTGVLALQGLQAEQQEMPVWRDDSFTVVHRASPSEAFEEPKNEEPVGAERLEEEETAPSGAASEPSAWTSDIGWGDVSSGSRDTSFEPPASRAEPMAEPEAESPYPPYTLLQDEGGTKQEAYEHRPEEPQQLEESQEGFTFGKPETSVLEVDEARPESLASEPPALSADNSPALFDADPAAEAQPEESREPEKSGKPAEKPDVKVALNAGGKASDAAEHITYGVGLLSALGEKGAIREAELRELRSAQPEEGVTASSKVSTGEEVEWTKLFLSKGSEAQPFRKVKMCIVQREDTLESIAARYNVPVRDLQIRNRLNDPYLSEGQVLYIP